MLSHAEAQALVSARLDGPLDPIAARELDAHLATCPSCRAFNASSTQLMRGLRQMPQLPASPAVKRAVIDHIRTSRTPWNVITGPWVAKAVPVATAVAAALIVTVLGAFAYQRLNDTRSPLDAVTSFLAQPAAETEPPDSNVTFEATDQATEAQQASDTESTGVPEDSGSTARDSEGPTPPTEPVDLDTETQPADGNAALEPAATPAPTDVPTATPPPTATEAPTEEPAATAVPTATATPTATSEASATEASTATTAPTAEPTATPPPADVPTATPPPTATTEPIATAEPTATPSPTDVPTATATEVPTSEPTATAAPTAEPTATATAAPPPTDVPTATIAPTAEPTATPPPTNVPTATATPTQEPTATATATSEPTATDVPTATPPPTQEPTATDVPTATAEPTATDVPTAASDGQIILPVDGTVVDTGDEDATQEDQATSVDPTLEPSPEDDITPTSGGGEGVIDPVDGQTPVDDAGDEQTPVDDAGDEQTPQGSAETDEATEEEGVIEPIGGVVSTQDATEDTSTEESAPDPATETPEDPSAQDNTGDDGSGDGVIEPRDGGEGTQDASEDGSGPDSEADQATATSDRAGDNESRDEPTTAAPGDESSDNSGTAGNDSGEGTSDSGLGLGSAQEVATTADVPGDPGQRLGVTNDNALEFDVNPGRVSLSNNGVTLEAGDVESGRAVLACDGSGSCIDISSASAGGSHSDYPLGWIGSDIIYERIDDNGVSFRAVQIDSDSLEVVDDRELGGGGSGLETLIRPYPVNGGLLVPSPDAWLFITADGVTQIDGNPYGGDIALIRIAPSSDRIAYVAGGEIIIASLGSPGSAQATVPFSGTDFDVSPDGSQIVVTDGAEIRILDLNGSVAQTFANDEGIAIGGIAWTQGRGIVYVDLSNGVLRSIEP